jgi:hypothetical protein
MLEWFCWKTRPVWEDNRKGPQVVSGAMLGVFCQKNAMLSLKGQVNAASHANLPRSAKTGIQHFDPPGTICV